MSMNVAKGLAGVVVDETRICKINKDDNHLYYYGYEINDLTKQGNYEEVSYLLSYGELPNANQLESYKFQMANGRPLSGTLKKALELVPKSADPMDVMRTACSLLGSLQPETKENNQFEIGARLANFFSSALIYWLRYHRSGKRIDTETGEDSVAGHFLHLLHGKSPDPLQRKALDVSLIIYAEHDFNASTYAGRIAASTLSDVYSCFTAAIAALRGPLHGGANARVMAMLEQFQSADAAERALLDMISKKARVFGFGQRAYATADPRSPINRTWARKLSEAAGDMVLQEVAERIEDVMWRERKIFSNLDYYTAVIYRRCGLPMEIFPPMFLIARTCGLIAHIAEQRANNKLIHPSSRYVGPEPRDYSPIDQRC